MKVRSSQPIRWGLVALATIWMLIVVPLSAVAAPYAAFVMDARSGEVLHSRNADTRLHPASLTKMMTLYVAFEAVENGEIGLDTPVRISRYAASEPPSKLGLRAGQTIRFRYLLRAAAVKSANDAATAIGEAIEGSEAKFARRMNRTAKAMGMTRTTFKNAHGLTESGHLSTARDMTRLGRHVFYDYPEYYNLFSRISANAGVRKVYHTNRRLLRNYRGADGIKTGYTRAAGFNLTASAERGGERIIATVFGGRSTASRNAKVAELLDLGFRRAPSRVALHKPRRPAYMGKVGNGTPGGFGRKVRPVAAAAVKKSLRPQVRPVPATAPVVIAAKDDIEAAIKAAQAADVAAALDKPEQVATAALPKVKPEARPKKLVLASVQDPAEDPVQEVVTRISTSGGRNWGINVGRYPSQYKARKVLLKTALNEMSTLDGSLRKVVERRGGFDANFMGLSRETADLACRRLQAKQVTCFMIEPGGGA
jgi:D-alanyl-D-alanine carboxypeptidase